MIIVYTGNKSSLTVSVALFPLVFCFSVSLFVDLLSLNDE